MRIGWEHLIFVALAAVVDAAASAPVPVTSELPFALAWLFQQSDGDRSHYDHLWLAVQQPGARASDRRGAVTHDYRADGCIQAIMRGLGFNPTVSAVHALSHQDKTAFWAELDRQAELGERRRGQRECRMRGLSSG